MYIWPNGEVTGSVHLDALEAFNKALADGEPLDPRFIPDGLTEADYPRPPKPKPAKQAPAKATEKEG